MVHPVAVPDSFERDGWFVVADFFSADECDAVVVEAASGFKMPVGDEADGPLEYRPMLTLGSDALVRWATDERWADVVVPLVGPDVRLYWEQVVTKPPHARTEVPWHQDNGYAPVEPAEYLTCWLALEDATLANGCLWVLPGSHRGGTTEHTSGGWFQVGYRGDEHGVPLEMPKGSLLVFNSLMQHRSGPNETDSWRRAWIVQFCPAHAVHGLSGRPFTDRLLVASDGAWLADPVRDEPFDLDAVLAGR